MDHEIQLYKLLIYSIIIICLWAVLYVRGKQRDTLAIFAPRACYLKNWELYTLTHKCIKINKEMFLVPRELEGTSVQLIFFPAMKS